MGQYYTPTIISADGVVKTLCSHEFGSGSKLMEHSWIGNEFVNAVYSRIYKQRAAVAWIGDYSDDSKKDYEDGEEPFTLTLSHKDFIRYYKIAMSENKKHMTHPDEFTDTDFNILTHQTKGMYLVNHTHSRYLDLTKYIKRCRYKEDPKEKYYWCVNPLPLLTACGNGRGGGDYHKVHPCYKDVGAWAFHTLEYTDEVPDSYVEAVYSFSEDRSAVA